MSKQRWKKVEGRGWWSGRPSSCPGSSLSCPRPPVPLVSSRTFQLLWGRVGFCFLGFACPPHPSPHSVHGSALGAGAQSWKWQLIYSVEL